MKTVIPVELPQLTYDIKIATDGLQYLGPWLSATGQRGKVLLVSNPVIFKHYGEVAVNSLTEAGFEVCQCILPAGERYKTLRSIEKIHNVAFEHRLERSSTMVALGVASSVT